MQRPVLVAAFAAAFLMGCPPSNEFKSLDPGAVANAEFSSPFDATLSPDGKIAYFSAVTPNGPGILTMTVGSSSAPSVLAAGDPLVSPMALDVTSDGKTLYIADTGAGVDLDDSGRLFTLATSGGQLTPVEATAGYKPRGLVVVDQDWADQVYFSGNDPADDLPGVFKITAGGSTVDVIAKGGPFNDPSGVVVADNRDVYVVDTAGADKTASVLKINKTGVTPLLTGIRVGYPAGIAISSDQQILIVSALDPERGTDLVIRYNLQDGSTENFTSGIDAFQESAGLHRAKKAESYVWADSLANEGGTVYVINKIQ